MNHNKQYRISRTEEKVIELLRDKDSWDSIFNLVMNNSSFKAYTDLQYLLNIFKGTEEYEGTNLSRRSGGILTGIKRLKDEEYQALLFIRTFGGNIFKDVCGNLDYDLIASNSDVFKLYNLVSRGISKTFDDLLESGFINSDRLEAIKSLLSDRSNIMLEGALNTGKITLLNAILYYMNDLDDKVFVVDDNLELQLGFLGSKSSINLVTYKDLSMDFISNLPDKSTFVVTNLGDLRIQRFLNCIDDYISSRKVNIIGVLPSESFESFYNDNDSLLLLDKHLSFIDTESIDNKKIVSLVTL